MPILGLLAFFIEQTANSLSLWMNNKVEEPTEGQQEVELPNHRQMTIQLAKEIWFFLLAFVPRRQLGQIVPHIGDRQFAGIAQSFLHDAVDNKVTLGNIWIMHLRWDDSGRPRLELAVWPKFAKWCEQPWSTLRRQLVLPAADVPMPENIKDFVFLRISYLDTSVLNFMRQFHQNSLFRNVNLFLGQMYTNSAEEVNSLLTTMAYVLPLIRDNINSIRLWNFEQLRLLCNADSDMAMDMLKMPRILECMRIYDFEPDDEQIHLLKRWLFTPRDDGKPRVLISQMSLMPTTHFLHFIDNSIKMHFSTAKRPCSFFIRLFVVDCRHIYNSGEVEWHHDSCGENGETKEKLVIKMVALTDKLMRSPRKVVLISRYPLSAGNTWIKANEQEALDWDFDEQNRKICMDASIQNAM